MSKQTTKATINANIKQNGRQEITGQVLNSVLNAMVDDYAEQASTLQEIEDFKEEVNNTIETFEGSVNETINEFKEEVNDAIAEKADKGGRYPAMSVGSAEALVTRGTATSQEFLTKIASASGASEVKALKGNSVVWNQRVSIHQVTADFSVSGVSVHREGNKFILNGTSNADGALVIGGAQNLIQGHKYVLFGSDSKDYGVNIYDSRLIWTPLNVGCAVSSACTSTGLSLAGLRFAIARAGITFTNKVVYCGFADLTQMFGAGNEPSTYEEFLARSPKVADPFAYNEGVIVSSNPSGIKTTGRNLWDEEWENGMYSTSTGAPVANASSIRSKNFIAVSPSTTYYFKNNYQGILPLWYDANKNFIGIGNWSDNQREQASPSNAYYLKFYGSNGETTYDYGTCINVSDPSFNGQYEPYDGHLLPINLADIKKDGVSLFPNGLLSAGSAYDEVRKNKAVKRIGVKVFDGTESWRRGFYGSVYCFHLNLPDTYNTNILYQSISNLYPLQSSVDAEAWADNAFCMTGYTATTSGVFIADSAYTSVSAWQAHLADLYASGKPLVVIYELAEPIVVDVDFNGVFLTTENGMVEVLDSVPMKADIVEAKDYIGIIEDLVRRVEALEG